MNVTVTVDPHRQIGRVDPRIYGQFLSRRRYVADGGLYAPEHPDADETGLRRQVVDAVAAGAPTVVRWPGGCTGTSYDWKDGVGPQEDRPRTIDAHFGYDVGNGFGTAEFVAFCRRIGAEPHINLNTGLGTLREALEWLEYTNLATPSRWANGRRAHGQEEPFDVRLWQIGNEEYGPWEIGHLSAADYAAKAREWAKSLKKLDSSIEVVAVGGSQRGLGWDQAVLQEAWDHIDFLTAHRYWSFDSATGFDNYDTIAGIGYLEEQTAHALGELIALVARDRKSERRPKLAYTEWNCRDNPRQEMSPDWRPTDSQYRLVDALAVAGFLNMMQRQCRHIGLANFAQTINVVGMLVVTDDAVVRESVYWPLRMARHHSGPLAVDAWADCGGYTADFEGRSVSGIPYLDVSATMDEAGSRLFVSLVNRHRDDEAVVRLALRDATIADKATVHRLWHSDPFARNTVADPDLITPTEETIDLSTQHPAIALPPHSYTILDLPLTT